VAGGPAKYWGHGFSLRGEKNRFVLPADFRTTVRNSSDGQRTLCLDLHAELPCIVGFGLSRIDEFEAQIEREFDMAKALGDKSFNRTTREGQLYGFTPVSFDESGRFVLPEHLGSSRDVGEALYFHGGGSSFTIWSPERLLALTDGWESAQASCRALMAETANGKGRRK
jgi:MraZ protein